LLLYFRCGLWYIHGVHDESVLEDREVMLTYFRNRVAGHNISRYSTRSRLLSDPQFVALGMEENVSGLKNQVLYVAYGPEYSCGRVDLLKKVRPKVESDLDTFYALGDVLRGCFVGYNQETCLVFQTLVASFPSAPRRLA